MAALLSIRPPPASYIYSSSSALTVSSPSSSTSPASSSHRVQRTTDELHAQLGTIMAIKKGGAAGLKQILKRCSSLGRRQQQQQSQNQGHGWEEEEEAAPSDVPRGHFAVYVGESRRRFVVPIAVLDRPEFRSLLRRAEEEFGFGGAGDLLVLPCEELAFRSLCSASSLPCAAAR